MPELKDAREHMVEAQIARRGIRAESVLSAMREVPREEFVALGMEEFAYEDGPLPIGEGQTISQPYIVALMVEAAQIMPADRVLEVGTGSGYQTALLAELAASVISIERHAALAHDAKQALTRLGYRNVVLLLGDGSQGVPAYAPYDDIVVAAAAPEIPPALFDQLQEGGRMVVPIGPRGEQKLELVEKHSGSPAISTVVGCRFVPLIGVQGYSPED